MEKKELIELKLHAVKCRQNVLRMIRAGGHGHIGGAFSAMDIVTALYFYKMKVDPQNPKMPDRDRFLLSAGHKCLCQYANLAEKGFFPKEILDTYASLKCPIPGHPDMHKLPGVEANTGALGHGLSIAVGMALSLRLSYPQTKTYVILGDGELAEGSNWEALAVASKYKADNLVAFLDYNGLQIGGRVEDVMDINPIAERFQAFGWATMEIDGNDMEQIVAALDQAPLCKGKPTMIIAHTVKAKGLKFGENRADYHFWTPSGNQLEQAEQDLAELAEQYEAELKAV